MPDQTLKIYSCLLNRGVNSNSNTVIANLLFDWFPALNHTFHTDIFCSVNKIGFFIGLFMYTDLFT